MDPESPGEPAPANTPPEETGWDELMRRRSIEQKIFLLIFTICLIPPVTFLLLLGLCLRPTLDETIGAELSNRAEYLSRLFDGFLSDKIERLRQLARLPAGEADRLAASAGKETGAAGVVILPSGLGTPQVALANPDDKFGRWLAEAPFFKPVVQQSLHVPPEGLCQDMELSMPARITPMPLFLFTLETPAHERIFFVFEAAKLVKAFRLSLPQHPEAFHIYSSSGFVPYAFETTDTMLGPRIREAMNEPRRPPSGFIGLGRKDARWFALADAKDPFLIAPADSNLMKHLRLKTGQGVVWTILLSYDMESFLGPLDGFIWLAVVIALALTLIMLAVGIMAGGQIIRPLLVLKRQAEAIARGQLDIQVRVKSPDEIGELAESFNAMVGQLRSTHSTLEERLADNQLRASHINVINEITGAIIQVLSLDSIFEILVREVGKLVAFDAMWIALFDERQGALRITHIHPTGLHSLFDRGQIPLNGSIHGHVVDSHETIHAEIGLHDRAEFFETRILRAEGFQSYLIAPLPSRSRIIGTLTIASTAPDAFNNSLTLVMSSLAGAVAIAIEQTDLFQRISRFATELEHKVDDRTRELERANTKLIQTEKYFATGRMAGNLAHEINNPLAIIKNYLCLVENNLKQAEGGRRRTDINLTHIQIINEEVDRIARMIHQMLNLHRPEEQVIKSVDVNGLIEEILLLMERDLERQGIRVVRELTADLPKPLGSPDLIRQVLINLIRNAQDAMEQGGTLTVRSLALSQWSEGAEQQLLRIRITDSGGGIPAEHLSQIFDPFFTTKSPDKGTGLGLCVSYSIIRMYRGSIDVESKPGGGTTVVVTLPLENSEEEVPELPALPETSGLPAD